MNCRIKPYYSIVAHSPDIAEIRYGVWNVTSFTVRDDSCSGKLARLLFRLDGALSVEEIAAAEGVAGSEVEELIGQMLQLGVLETAPTNALDYLLERMPGAGGSGLEWPSQTMPVAVIGDIEIVDSIARLLRGTLPNLSIALPPETVAPLESALGGQEDELAFQADLARFSLWRDRLVIVAQRVIDPELLHRINRICLGIRTPWLCAAMDGPFLFIGPLTVPTRSACFDCFETRVMMNLREAASYQRYKRAIVERLVRVGAVPVEPVVMNLLASHTSIEAINYLVTQHSCLVDKVLSVYLPTMEFAYHELLRVPNCRSCAPQSFAMRRELYFDKSAVIAPLRSFDL